MQPQTVFIFLQCEVGSEKYTGIKWDKTKLCKHQSHEGTVVPEKHKYITGVQPEIFQGRGGSVKLGHFDKHFIKKSRKKGSVEKNFGVFSLRYF